MIQSILIAIITMINPIWGAIGLTNFLSVKIPQLIGMVSSSDVAVNFSTYLGYLYYFVPKSLITTCLGVVLATLFIRIVMAIVAEVWIG